MNLVRYLLFLHHEQISGQRQPPILITDYQSSFQPIFVVYHDAAAYPEYLIKFTDERRRRFNSPASTQSRDRQLVAGHPPVRINYPLHRGTRIYTHLSRIVADFDKFIIFEYLYFLNSCNFFVLIWLNLHCLVLIFCMHILF